jgi:DNA replication protein DnaC
MSVKETEQKKEFNCRGYEAFIKGIAYNVAHKYTISEDKVKSNNDYAESISNLCPECRARAAEIWFNSVTTKRQQDLSFETFKDKESSKAHKVAIAFTHSAIKSDDSSLVFWSNSYGTGKTHLAISIARLYLKIYMSTLEMKELYKNAPKNPVNIVSESDLIDKIRASFDNENSDSESKIVQRYTDTKLLILDDVGKVTFAKDDFLHRIYFLIIDRIYNNKTGLVLTCNGGLHKLSGHIGEACVSRLYEMCNNNIYEVAGKDYRQNTKTGATLKN